MSSKFITVDEIKPLALEHGWDYRDAQPATRQRQDISRTTEDEILSFLENAHRDVEMYARQIGLDPEGRLKHDARLHAVYEYAVPETFVCTLPCAEIGHRDGLVVSQHNEILIQSLSQRNATQVKYLFGEGRKYPLSVSEGRHVALLCFAHYNYFHWLLDAALRLMLLDPDDASFKVIVPATTARFIRQILELLGISEDRVVAVSDQSRLRVDELVFAYPSRTPAKPNSAHFMELRRRLFAGAGIDPTTKIPHRRLYISRANSARRILNEDELLPILRHHGFEIIFSEEYTIAEQIALFAEASVIAGAHGAGFTNVLFARPGTTVIEIFNRRIWFDCYAKMSSLLGQEHWHMFAENEDDETFSTRVDARKFEKLLDYALR